MACSKISLALACLILFVALPSFAQNLEKPFSDALDDTKKDEPAILDNSVVVDAQNNQAPDMVKDDVPTSSDNNLEKEFLDAHNQARAKENLKPLTWDKQLADYAQGYANQRKEDCQLVHSNGPYGENIAGGSGDFSATEAVKMWVDEKPNYNPQANTCISDDQQCLHYTQVVWRDTVRLGCSKARCNDGGTFIICNYDPCGNVIGEKPF